MTPKNRKQIGKKEELDTLSALSNMSWIKLSQKMDNIEEQFEPNQPL